MKEKCEHFGKDSIPFWNCNPCKDLVECAEKSGIVRSSGEWDEKDPYPWLQNTHRRLRMLHISRDMLSHLPDIDVILTKSGMPIKITGIPDGAKVVAIEYDIRMDSLVMILEHPSFEEVPEGYVISPCMYTVHTKSYKVVEVEGKLNGR